MEKFKRYVLPILGYIMSATLGVIALVDSEFLEKALPEDFKFFPILCIAFITLVAIVITFLSHISWQNEKNNSSQEILLEQQERLNNKHEKLNSEISERLRGREVLVESVSQRLQAKQESDGERIKTYYKLAYKYIRNAQKNLLIFDYLCNHLTLNSVIQNLEDSTKESHNPSLLLEIQDSCTQHYETIESHFPDDNNLQVNELEYTRILMLPLLSPNHFTSTGIETQKWENKKLSEVINIYTLSHIKRMLKKKEDSHKYKGQIHFRIMPFAVTNYSFGIVDNKKLLLELDFYDISANPLQSHLFVIHDENNGAIVKPFQQYNKIYNDRCFDLNLQSLDMTVTDLRNRAYEARKTRIHDSRETHEQLV